MLGSFRLATASPRQLEHLLASTPAFLLPSFASLHSPTSSPRSQRRKYSSGASVEAPRSTPSAAQISGAFGTRTQGDALGVGTSKSGLEMMTGQTRKASTAAAAQWHEAEEDHEEYADRVERREGKGVADGLEDRLYHLRTRGQPDSTSSPAEPPTPSPLRSLHTRQAIAESRSKPSPSIPAPTDSVTSPRLFPPNPYGVSTRSELMQLLGRIPSSTSLSHFLSLQALLRTIHRMDDSGPVAALASAAIRADEPQIDFACRLLKQALQHMRQASTSCNPSWLLEAPTRLLGQRKQWEQVVSFTNVAVAQGFASVRLIEWRLKALYELRRYPETVEAFGLFQKHLIKPTGDAYDDLVGAQLLNANLPAAQAALTDKAERGFPTTAKTCLALLDGMWMFGGNRVMEQRVLEEENRKVLRRRAAMCQDVKVLNRIMSVRAARGDHEDAFAVLPYFDLDANRPLGLSIRSHTSAATPLPFHSAEHSAPAPHEFYRPRPDLATIVILMGTFLRLRRAELATSLFVDSQLAGLGLNEYLVATVVRTHLADADLPGAEQFVFALARGEATISKPQSQVDQAGSQTDEVRLQRFDPSAMTYEVLLGGVLRYRGLKGAADLLERMASNQQHQSVEVTEGMVAALVEYVAIERGEEPRTSAELIVKMYELSARRRKPTISNLNKLLEATWRNERWAAGTRGGTEAPWATRRALKKAEAREKLMPPAFKDPAFAMTADPTSPPSLFPRSSSFTRSARSSSTLLDPVDRIHSSLRDRRTQPDRSTTQHHLRSSSPPSVNSMWDYLQTSLIDRGIRPTHTHLSIIIRAHLRLGDPSGAHETLQRSFDQLGVEPHVSLYSVLIGGLSKLGMWDQAMTVYKEMRERGIEPDRTMYATLALRAARKRDVQGVQKAWDEAARRLATSVEDDPTSHGTDVRLDPVFVSIMYRALATSGDLLAAQQLIAKSLEAGMKPDPATLMVLKRTRRWLKWKSNKTKAQIRPRAPHRTSILDSSTTLQHRSAATRINQQNLRRVRSALRQAKPIGKGGLRELQKLEPFLLRSKHAGAVTRDRKGRKGRRRSKVQSTTSQ